jgi:hypothetical protein
MSLVISPRDDYVNLPEVGSEGRWSNSPATVEDAGFAAFCRNRAIAAIWAQIAIEKSRARLQFFKLILRQMDGNGRVVADDLLPNNVHTAQGIAHYSQDHDTHGDQKLIEREAPIPAGMHLRSYPKLAVLRAAVRRANPDPACWAYDDLPAHTTRIA